MSVTDESRDHDEAYRFGVHLTATWHWPFNDCQFWRLMVLRSRVHDGTLQGDDRCDPPPSDPRG